MTTQFESKWLVPGIDLITVAVSFFLAYLIRFNLNLNFDVSKLWIQLPAVVLITLMALLITGSYKGEFRHIGSMDVSNIFKAICLSSILLILLIAINRKLGVFAEFSIPISIIIIFGLLSFVGLTASRYLFKIFNALVNKNHK